MKRLFLTILASCSISFLPACAQLGIAAPETFNQKLAVGYITVTAVRETATKLVVAKKLNPDDAQNVQNQADTARAGLDVARDMFKATPVVADNKLTSVTTALRALQTYLASKQ